MKTINDEPLNPKRCHFCNCQDPTNILDHHIVTLYSIENHTQLVVYASVEYRKMEVDIPRCYSCRNIHERVYTSALLQGWGVSLLLLIYGFFEWGYNGFFGLIAFPLVGILMTKLIENLIVKYKGILSESNGAEKNVLVQHLLTNGWSFDEPRA